MRKRLIAFGNNAFSSLDPHSTDLQLLPCDITNSTECDTVFWHSWSATLAHNSVTGVIRSWGTRSSSRNDNQAEVIVLPQQCRRIIGHDEIEGFLTPDVFVQFDGQQNSGKWDDMIINGLGQVYVLTNGSLHVFKSKADFLNSEKWQTLQHPLLTDSANAILYASDSRVFVLIEGWIQHLFEVDDGHMHPACPDKPFLRPIDDFEGQQISIVPGNRNRMAVITDAGDLFLFSTRSKEPDLIELPGEDVNVRLAGVGSEMEIVVTEDAIMVRGSNQYGALGVKEIKDTSGWIALRIPGVQAQDVKAVHTSRWSTILEVEGD